MRRNNQLLMLFAFVLAPFIGVNAQTLTMPRTASPAAEITQTVGISQITVNYSRPSVNEREIWGKLVPYGYNNLGFGTATAAPWRAGANENTTISFSHKVTFQGKEVEPGTYGLFIAVEEGNAATVILSNETEAWGSYFYDESEDAVRVAIKTEETAMTERLTYDFINLDATSATLILDWEKKRFPVNISLEVPELVYQSMKKQLKGSNGFTDVNWNAAAGYLLQNKIHLDEALVWSENAISAPFVGVENFNNLQMKSLVLAALNKTSEADAVMAKALEHPTANANGYYAYGRTLIGANQDKKALEIFNSLSKKWPKHWLAPHGLARGYAANGEIKKALKYEKIALDLAPDASKTVIEGYISTLESGEDFN